MSDPKDQLKAKAAELRDRADALTDKAEKLPGRKTLGDFKAFLTRGNVVDLAVAVVIGAVFSEVVKALVSDLITPLIGLVIPGNGLFGDRKWVFTGHGSWLHGSTFPYGHFLNTLVTFLVTSAAVFFLVVRPINKLLALRKTGTDSDTPNKTCTECLSSIPVKARRCAFCTSEQPVEEAVVEGEPAK